MCITIHQTLLPHDDPNAFLAPIAAMTRADGTVKEAEHGDHEGARLGDGDGDTMSMATEVLRNG
jgi:hypothetical protein